MGSGHPFEIQLACNILSSTTTNVLVNLYNAKATAWKDGPYAGTYTLGTLGSGCTKVVTGTANSGLTSTAGVNFWMKASFSWSAVTKILALNSAAQYLNGAVVPVSATSNVTTVANTDLSFIPSFTFASGGTNTVTILEFLVNRL